jgi:hypothetical protein
MKRIQAKGMPEHMADGHDGIGHAMPPQWMERSRAGAVSREHMADGRSGDGHWMEKAFKPAHRGRLHEALGVPQGKKIPAYKVDKAAKAPGHLGQMARAAENAGR